MAKNCFACTEGKHEHHKEISRHHHSTVICKCTGDCKERSLNRRAQRTRLLEYASFAPGAGRRHLYLKGVIKQAAARLREGVSPDLVATDLEDSQTWHVRPSECAHPYQDPQKDGSVKCRTCGTDTSHDEGMGG